MEEELNALKNEVRILTSKNKERAQVAFSASLYGSVGFKNFGPHEEATTLVYDNVFTNIGEAYDKNTGIFTAPVKGVYFFNYVVFNPSDYATGIFTAPVKGVYFFNYVVFNAGYKKDSQTVLLIEAMMKLEIGIVLLLCTWTTLADDLMNPTLDILSELKKIKTMEEELNALKKEVRILRSKNEGIFTAPVKGVYFFNYVVFNPSDYATGVRLLKNSNFVVAASDNPNGQDREDTTSNSVSLALEQGDQIHLQLMENRRVYEDTWRRNTFSGHLLFAL
ncbi:adiponectin-like isoform X1 [Labeo rohita]|uniref:Adiponectin-like isoform X1 n=1 Tax=Labeo rohita TaxID=84645 RepID=A0A498P229_LABRO|nr:adiponectin-like isoform X1 [Labeo rohita]